MLQTLQKANQYIDGLFFSVVDQSIFEHLLAESEGENGFWIKNLRMDYEHFFYTFQLSF